MEYSPKRYQLVEDLKTVLKEDRNKIEKLVIFIAKLPNASYHRDHEITTSSEKVCSVFFLSLEVKSSTVNY